MNKINEKASVYAANNNSEFLTYVLEQAFADGYKEGFKQAVDTRATTIVDDSGVEYIDLGLPSGTRWATSFLKDEHGNVKTLAYDEAKTFNLPTEEEWRELLDNCSRAVSEKWLEIAGLNGNSIKLYTRYGRKVGKTIQTGDTEAWLFTGGCDDRKVMRALCLSTDSRFPNGYMGSYTVFRGTRLPVLLVKRTEKPETADAPEQKSE